MSPRTATTARLILVSVSLLLLNVQAVVGQAISNSTSTTSNPATNGINFDFTSAAVASFVLVMLGLTAVLVLLARLVSRPKIS